MSQYRLQPNAMLHEQTTPLRRGMVYENAFRLSFLALLAVVKEVAAGSHNFDDPFASGSIEPLAVQPCQAQHLQLEHWLLVQVRYHWTNLCNPAGEADRGVPVFL